MKSQDWDIFYLGVFPNIVKEKCTPTNWDGIYKVKGYCLHSYVVNRKTMKTLIDLSWDKVRDAIDHYYMVKYKKCYAIYPTMFYQGLYESDIGYNLLAVIGTPSRLKFYYRCIESYAYKVNYPLILFIPIIILIIAWFVTGVNKIYRPLDLVLLILSLLAITVICWQDK